MMKGRHLWNDAHNKGNKVDYKVIFIVFSVKTCEEKEYYWKCNKHFPLMTPLLSSINLFPMSFTNMFMTVC